MGTASADPIDKASSLNKDGQTIGRKGAQSRARLLLAAREMLPQVPVHKLTPSAIGRRAGLASQTFYLYFRSVEELLLQLCAEVVDEAGTLADALDRPGSLTEQAEAFVADFYRFWDRHRPVLTLRNFFADSGQPAFVEERNKASLPVVRRIAARIAQADPNGVSAADAFARAVIIFAAIERMAAHYSAITQEPGELLSGDLRRAEAHVLSLLLSPGSPPQ